MSGKVAIIFGVGAVHGLGAALARKFAREGMNVLLAGRTQEKLDNAAGSIAEGGGKAATAIADVTRPDEVARALQAYDEAFTAVTQG